LSKFNLCPMKQKEFLHLPPNSDRIAAIRVAVCLELGFTNTVTVLIRLTQGSIIALRDRRAENNRLLGHIGAHVLLLVIVPAVQLDEAHLGALNTLRPSRKRVRADLGAVSLDNINQSADPFGALGVLDVQLVLVIVRADDLNSTAHAGTAVSTVGTVGVVGGGALLEAGEDAVDDGKTVVVFTGLQTGVAHVVLVDEAELLGEVEAALVRSAGDVHWEENLGQALVRDVLDGPADADHATTLGCGGLEEWESEEEGLRELHFDGSGRLVVWNEILCRVGKGPLYRLIPLWSATLYSGS
jgi:hypothetical protein